VAVGHDKTELVQHNQIDATGRNRSQVVGLNRRSTVGVDDSTMVGGRWSVTIARGLTSRLTGELNWLGGMRNGDNFAFLTMA
jgi:hypothetical protein